jgi:hypothetical protein
MWDQHLTTPLGLQGLLWEKLYFFFLSSSLEYKQQQLDSIGCLHPYGGGDSSFSKILITTTWCHNIQDHNPNVHHCENVTSYGDKYTPCRKAE